jgi:hypothetical protein
MRERMTNKGVCGVLCPMEVYIVSDSRERCSWLQMIEIGVCRLGRSREMRVCWAE